MPSRHCGTENVGNVKRGPYLVHFLHEAVSGLKVHLHLLVSLELCVYKGV